jgi:hypothetical protein
MRVLGLVLSTCMWGCGAKRTGRQHVAGDEWKNQVWTAREGRIKDACERHGSHDNLNPVHGKRIGRPQVLHGA